MALSATIGIHLSIGVAGMMQVMSVGVWVDRELEAAINVGSSAVTEVTHTWVSRITQTTQSVGAATRHRGTRNTTPQNLRGIAMVEEVVFIPMQCTR